MTDYWLFLRRFFKHAGMTGAVAPSSHRLGQEMICGLPLDRAAVVVEYGPGTGSFTGRILQEIGKDTRFFAIESDSAMTCRLTSNYPDIEVVNESVECLPDIIRSIGSPSVDCIVSGLPWASFDCDLQDRLMDVTLAALKDGGRFHTFTYLQGLAFKSGRRFRDQLKHRFTKVILSPVVWYNFPPALVYKCIK